MLQRADIGGHISACGRRPSWPLGSGPVAWPRDWRGGTCERERRSGRCGRGTLARLHRHGRGQTDSRVRGQGGPRRSGAALEGDGRQSPLGRVLRYGGLRVVRHERAGEGDRDLPGADRGCQNPAHVVPDRPADPRQEPDVDARPAAARYRRGQRELGRRPAPLCQSAGGRRPAPGRPERDLLRPGRPPDRQPEGRRRQDGVPGARGGGEGNRGRARPGDRAGGQEHRAPRPRGPRWGTMPDALPESLAGPRQEHYRRRASFSGIRAPGTSPSASRSG